MFLLTAGRKDIEISITTRRTGRPLSYTGSPWLIRLQFIARIVLFFALLGLVSGMSQCSLMNEAAVARGLVESVVCTASVDNAVSID